MPRTKRSNFPPVTVGIARSRRSEVRRTPNGGWAWSCSLCKAYAELSDAAGHKLCCRHASLETSVLRDKLIDQHRFRTGKWPKTSTADWGRTSINDLVLREEMLRQLKARG